MLFRFYSSYDAFGRFDTHQHTIGGSTEYTLDMTYNKGGGIVKKDALATGITNFQDLNYTLNYNYSASNPYQLEEVVDSKSGVQSHYLYNSSGSIQEIQDPAAGGPQSFFWNEEQWLSGVSNDLGVHHYVYDYKGERVMKSSVMHSSVQINDKNIDDVQYLEPYTLYINPYYVVTELQGGDKVSKHYYMNTQRVATDISINYQAQESMAGPQQPNARDPKKPSEDTASVNYNAAFADLQATLNALGHQKIDVNGLGQQPTLEQYYPELVRETALNTTAAKNAPESTTRVLFWYHPDYLGNVDLVTERDGKTYEFFTYNPWSEEMHQYNANTFSFSSPYRFNSKEKDEETGLHYYGARYYQPKLSVWLSVDPKAHMAPDWTPYRFNFDNPIKFIDPDGRFETPGAAKEFAKSKGISGEVVLFDDGLYRLADQENGRIYVQNADGNVSNRILLAPIDVTIYENSAGSNSPDGDHVHGLYENINKVVSNIGIANGVKDGLIDGAIALERGSIRINKVSRLRVLGKAASYSKYIKGVGIAVGIISTTVSVANAVDYYYSGGEDYGVGGKASMDAVMTAVGIFGGPIGIAVSAAYFIVDASGGFGNFGKVD